MWSFHSARTVNESLSQQVEKAADRFLGRTDLGFFRADTFAKAQQDCQKHAAAWASYQSLVVIGLGGSSLGARTLIEALVPASDRCNIHFLDNVDSFSLQQWLQSKNDWRKTAWIVCSKSGGTIESLALYDFCSQFLNEKWQIDISKSSFVISEDKDSPLTEFARKKKCPQLSIPLDVGGRFSVFTSAGLFPATFFSLNLESFASGCRWSVENKKMVAKVTEQLWNSHQQKEVNFYSFQYCDRLSTFGLWLQQLWSESLGKASTRKGDVADPVATIVPCRGASDQHSVLQQIVEGVEKKFVGFHRVTGSEKVTETLNASHFAGSLMVNKGLGQLLATQAQATEQAVRESHAGTMVLKTDILNEESLAALMMLWMLVTGVLGELLDINAFDQPGVESGKIITRRVLSQAD